MHSRALLVVLSAACCTGLPTRGPGAQTGTANAGEYSPAEAAQLRRAVTLQNWDDGGDLSRFVYLHTSEIFPSAVIHRSGPVSDLAVAPDPRVGAYRVKGENGREEDLNQYIAAGHGIDGLIVLHHGRIVYEAYPRMRMQDKHWLASVTKAFVGTAVGILEDREQIDIHRTVGEYILALKSTPWGQVTIRDVLEMASGMEGANESYTDPKNKHYQYEASLGWQPTTLKMPELVVQGDTYRYLAFTEANPPTGGSLGLHERQYRDTRMADRGNHAQKPCGGAQ